ncbi:MAG TPA: PIG-L family deacetylase [Thermoanaerobaculaceae bacterium]|nr:PIG-L family deacetylase [Thermoanaerobaculaceae bacterium]HRS14957.1 PIG-L family deacetylase [Thermoanaerobaculaceae bacterium]
MTSPLRLTPADRVLVVLPHPDDESLAAGGLLQHALEAGAAIRLLFATDGDNNPWAQRASERSVWITARDRARFGAIRRGEVLAALAALGVGGGAASFLAFPDQGLTALLMRADTHLLDDLRRAVLEFRPTVLVGPSMLDRHPDHSALGVWIALVLEGVDLPLRHLRFFVHDPGQRRRPPGATVVALDQPALGRKRAAIDCHRTQQFWRGTWLRGFAQSEEAFFEVEPALLASAHPVRGVHPAEDGWEVLLASRSRFRSFGPSTLLLAGLGADRRPIRLSVSLWPPFGALPVTDTTSGAALGSARLRGSTRNGRLMLPAHLLPPPAVLYAKVEHAFGFFDEAGWRRVV